MAGVDPQHRYRLSRWPGPGARLDGRHLGAWDFQRDGASTLPSSATRGSGTVTGLEAGGSQLPGCLATAGRAAARPGPCSLAFGQDVIIATSSGCWEVCCVRPYKTVTARPMGSEP